MQTKGSEPFLMDMEYVLFVRADRVSKVGHQSTGEERLSIVGGKRPPQFYLASYEVEVLMLFKWRPNHLQTRR